MHSQDTTALQEAIEALSARTMALEVTLGALIRNPGLDLTALHSDFDLMAASLNAKVESMPFSDDQVAIVGRTIAEFREFLGMSMRNNLPEAQAGDVLPPR